MIHTVNKGTFYRLWKSRLDPFAMYVLIIFVCILMELIFKGDKTKQRNKVMLYSVKYYSIIE